ncbi:MAG: phosphatidylcholine/phosphatidylserine synthase [Sphingomonadaceae bacterium]|nr:phosphatidylcholine/phosphatidylserine synthase [Sphingomonadaceae bacterium]
MSEGGRGITLRAVAPNAITALALCFGLTAIRYAISASGTDPNPGDWERAIGAIVIAALLDGIDGRVARLLKGESRFGAELDSLSDVIAFGVSPALIIYLWSLQAMPRFGWICALALAVCCALRLARFNAAIDTEIQPHKSADFMTGVPAPAGAGLAFVPLYLWIATDNDVFRNPFLVAPWIVFVAGLMISNIATFSWASIRLRRNLRLEAILLVALVGAALFSEPWITLIAISALYLGLLPFSIRSYGRISQARTQA